MRALLNCFDLLLHFTVFLLISVDLSHSQMPSNCACDFGRRICDFSLSCDHGIWTTARKFDNMADTIKYGFCDCETGWSGNLCEYPSSEYETPESACVMNFGRWNGDFCRCSEFTFGRYCQFRMISIQDQKQECTCGHQRSYQNRDTYLCHNASSPDQQALMRVRVLANAQPVIIQPIDENYSTTSRVSSAEASSDSDEGGLGGDYGDERNMVEHYDPAVGTRINAWVPICIALIIIAVIMVVAFICHVRFSNRRGRARPIISDPITIVPSQPAITTVSETIVNVVKEAPPPSYESLEMR